jgi:hypothetical protein
MIALHLQGGMGVGEGLLNRQTVLGDAGKVGVQDTLRLRGWEMGYRAIALQTMVTHGIFTFEMSPSIKSSLHRDIVPCTADCSTCFGICMRIFIAAQWITFLILSIFLHCLLPQKTCSCSWSFEKEQSRLPFMCVSGGQDREGCRGSKGIGEGGGAQCRQPVVGLGRCVVLRPEAHLYDLKQMQKYHMGAHQKEALEFESSMEDQLHVFPLVNVT